jgi:outer membrane immunogenic protein
MMRCLPTLLASLLVVASSVIGRPARAADLPLKAASVPAPAFSWTGFYAGASVGARWADNNWTSSNIFPLFPETVRPTQTSGGMDSLGARLGGYAGHNWQLAPAWIIGIEADLGWGSNVKSATPAPGLAGTFGRGCGFTFCTNLPTAALRQDWEASLRGRVGTLVTPDLLLYATGGLAWLNVTASANCISDGTVTRFCLVPENESASAIRTGWTIGLGAEHRLFGQWLGRASYRYADYGTFSHQFFRVFPPGADERFTGNAAMRTHTVELGLAYKF